MATLLGVVVAVVVPAVLGVPVGFRLAGVIAEAILGNRWSV